MHKQQTLGPFLRFFEQAWEQGYNKYMLEITFSLNHHFDDNQKVSNLTEKLFIHLDQEFITVIISHTCMVSIPAIGMGDVGNQQ